MRTATHPAQLRLDLQPRPPEEPRVTPSLKDATMLGEAGMARAEKGAGEGFTDRAVAAAVAYLEELADRGVLYTTSELLTDAIKARGVKPAKDDRAFGAVHARLLREGTVLHIGDCKRRKGHGTPGGRVIALASRWPKDRTFDPETDAA